MFFLKRSTKRIRRLRRNINIFNISSGNLHPFQYPYLQYYYWWCCFTIVFPPLFGDRKFRSTSAALARPPSRTGKLSSLPTTSFITCRNQPTSKLFSVVPLNKRRPNVALIYSCPSNKPVRTTSSLFTMQVATRRNLRVNGDSSNDSGDATIPQVVPSDANESAPVKRTTHKRQRSVSPVTKIALFGNEEGRSKQTAPNRQTRRSKSNINDINTIQSDTSIVVCEISSSSINIVSPEPSTSSSSVTSATDELLSKPPRTSKRSSKGGPTTKKTTTKSAESDIDAVKNEERTVQPPKGWEEIYSLVEELRTDRTAPCDTDGCEALVNCNNTTPENQRYQVLIALMLSSQTKDAVVGAAMRALQKANVLDVTTISIMNFETLNPYICKVGFHNTKTKHIIEASQILVEKYNGDLPLTAAEMVKDIPGVGPKMAYICESAAWGTTSGIGVDTHMHRLFGLLNWVPKNTKTPEQTRIYLQSWLPLEKWSTVNLLWVGFGQEVQQQQPKILRKALQCSRPKEALALLKRCGMDYKQVATKAGLDDELTQILQSDANNETI